MLRVALLLSGAASLVYQIAWTRRLVTVTSATATAQALVLAVFMAGLGLGASLAGRRCAQLRRPAVAYAVVEVVAAALALGSFPVIGASDSLRAAALRLGAGAASSWLQLALLAAFLLVPTSLLGASLPLLIEHAERAAADDARGRSVASFYAWNTLGAGAGCVLAGFVTIERFGLLRTAMLGATFAVLGAGVAVAVSRVSPARREEAQTSDEGVDAVVPIERRTLLVAALAGLVGVGAEVVWTRLFALIIPNTVYTFTQVLVAVLVGIAVGALVAGVITRRVTDARDARARGALALAGLFAATSAVLLSAIPWVVVRFADDQPRMKALASGRSPASALLVLGCLVPVSALLAAILPLLVVARAATDGDRPSRSFGGIYGANIAGSVVGSLVVGFVLIPAIGVRGAGAALVLASLGLAALLLPLHTRLPALGVAALFSVGLHFTHDVPREIFTRRLDPGVIVRDLHEGASSNVMVTDDPRRRNERRLWINSFWVAGSAGPHRVFGLLPGLFTPEPKRVLGIALGTGQTFAAALRQGAVHLDCVEIDPGVVTFARRWFGELNGGLLDDARVTVHVEDGRTFMRAATERYDLIVLEPLQAWSAGTSSLYSREFYEEARRILAPHGVIAQWIPFYGQGPEETRAMTRTALDVFPSASLWLTGRDGVLLLSDAPFELRLDELDERIKRRELAVELAPLPARTAEDLLPYLLLGPTGLARWVAGAPVLVDDRPFLEFRAASQIGTTHANFQDILASAAGAIDELEPYLVAPRLSRERRVAVEQVRRAIVAFDRLRPNDFAAQLELLEALPDEARTILAWQAHYRAAIRLAVAAQVPTEGSAAALRPLYERALAHDPTNPDARRFLGKN